MTNKPWKEGEEPKALTQTIIELEEIARSYDKTKRSNTGVSSVIMAFLNGETVVKKIGIGSLRKESKYICASSSSKCLISDLLINPQDWEIYQEPKKAWIETRDFDKESGKIHDIDFAPWCKVGAIALAQEFLKRYDEIKFRKPMGEPIVSKIMSDLVGEENLK